MIIQGDLENTGWYLLPQTTKIPPVVLEHWILMDFTSGRFCAVDKTDVLLYFEDCSRGQ